MRHTDVKDRCRERERERERERDEREMREIWGYISQIETEN